MIESYVEYTLAQCSNAAIPSVCDMYKTKTELLEAAIKGFNGDSHILGQAILVDAAIDFIADDGYVVNSEFAVDGRKVHDRVGKNLYDMRQTYRQRIDINRDAIFNTLVELNWLLASKYLHLYMEQEGLISLIVSPAMIRGWTKRALNDVLFEQALYDKDRSEQYATAQLLKYQLFSGLHPDQEVRSFYGYGYTGSDFKELQSQARECSIRRMALFYGLTATAALAEEIRRSC